MMAICLESVNPILKCSLFSRLKYPLFGIRLREEERGDSPFPGMVRRRLVSLAVELDSFDLLDGGVDAFLIVQGDGRFAFAEDAVRQRRPL